MNNLFKSIAITTGFVLLTILFTSCGNNPTDASGDIFEDVPKGEIVPLEMRDEVLTGFSPGSMAKATDMTQKWWLQKVSKIDYQNCAGAEDEDISQNNIYYAFKPNGGMYVKSGQNGSEQRATGWEWYDEGKEAIRLDISSSVKFEITSLNESEVVYASVQEQEGGCKAVTWEQFGNPHSTE